MNQYMVLVESKQCPNIIHEKYSDAEKEAKRLALKELKNTYVLEILSEFRIETVQYMNGVKQNEL